MFERYTERARRVVFFARYEASKAGSATIESGYLLLGLLREDKNLTRRFLHDAPDIESIRSEIEQRSNPVAKVSTSVEVPLTDECKRILAYAAEEADKLQQRHVGTEHLLLGILREEKCVAAAILIGHGLRLAAVQQQLEKWKGANVLSSHWDAFSAPGMMTREEVMVPDAATAKRIAEAIWLPAYGAGTVAGQQPLDASLLDASLVRFRVWRVSAGPLFAFIRMTDGKILAMGQSEGANV